MNILLYLYWLIPIAIGFICFYIYGFHNALLHSFLTYMSRQQRRLRRFQRPSRIFLIRHGESEANVDTSKINFKTNLML
jgi:hypothetical protein